VILLHVSFNLKQTLLEPTERSNAGRHNVVNITAILRVIPG